MLIYFKEKQNCQLQTEQIAAPTDPVYQLVPPLCWSPKGDLVQMIKLKAGQLEESAEICVPQLLLKCTMWSTRYSPEEHSATNWFCLRQVSKSGAGPNRHCPLLFMARLTLSPNLDPEMLHTVPT